VLPPTCISDCIDKDSCIVKSICLNNRRSSAGKNSWGWSNSNGFSFGVASFEASAGGNATTQSSVCLSECIDKDSRVVKTHAPMIDLGFTSSPL